MGGLAVAIVIAAVIFLLMGVRVVRQGYVYTIERLGKYTLAATPGLHLIIPFIDRVGHRVSWCVRPEDVRLLPAGTDHMGHPGTVIDVVQLGPVAELEVSLAGGGELTASVPAAGAPALGTACRVLVPPTAITVWDDHS